MVNPFDMKTLGDYMQAEEEFKLRKAKEAQEIATAKAKVENPSLGGSIPSAIQVNSAIQKALDAGDTTTANRLAWLHRAGAYGIDTFPSDAAQPPVVMPTPSAPANDMPALPRVSGVENIPTGGTIFNGGGSSIAAQQARNEAMKSAAKEEAKLKQQLTYNPQIKQAEEMAKTRAGAEVELEERVAGMPQLMNTVGELRRLGKKATYTLAGQGRDWATRQAGLPVGEGAVARKEYVSLVDNQILPLLRQTFGAQFTQAEGQSLKATLGDPNGSPEEKDAVLQSFINQKKQTINTLERQLGYPVTNWDAGELPSPEVLAMGVGKAATTPAPPQKGQKIDGYWFLGGDPADPKNYKKVGGQ